MISKREEVIEFVRSNLPLRQLLKKDAISVMTSKGLMADIGFSLGAFSQLLDDFADEFSIKDNPNVEQEAKSRSFGFAFKSGVPRYRLSVPDLSIDDLVKVANAGVWPMEYYLDGKLSG